MMPASQNVPPAPSQTGTRYLIFIVGAVILLALTFTAQHFYSLSGAKTEELSLAGLPNPVNASPVNAAAPPVAIAKPLPKPDAKNLPNFAEVAPGIYRGAAPTAEGWKKLHELGIRTEIDLRIEKKGRDVAETATKEYGITRMHLPMGREAPTKKQVDTFLKTLNDPAQKPVFVHCQHGADRTGAMIGIYRETHDGWDFTKTYTEMRKYGFKPFLSELKGSVKDRAPKD
jgi:tyrosine-protein phosphatase SIW14